MSAILDILFPKRKKAAPTSTEIDAEIERHNALLADARARLDATAQNRTAARDGLNAAGMTAADNEAAGIHNEIEVAEIAIGALKVEHAAQVAREAADALTARRAAAEARLSTDAPKLLAEYDRLAAQLATVLDGLREIDREAEAVNHQLKGAGRYDEALDTIPRRYRFEEGAQDPDRIEIVEEWQERGPDGTWSRAVQLFQNKETGEMMPRYGGKKVKREVRHPGRKRRDTYLPSLREISLPAGRMGGTHHWPSES